MHKTSGRRIAAVITHNDHGGAQEALARLCASFRSNGHNVALWFLYRKSNFAPAALPYKTMMDRPPSGLVDYLKMMHRLRRDLAHYQPDALLSFLPLANIMGCFVGWHQGIAARIACQRNPVQTYSTAMRWLDWCAGSTGIYTHNVANSGDVLSSIQFYPGPYKRRMRTIYNGIPTGVTPPLDKAVACAALGEKGNATLLVTAGRLARQKNQVFLIQLMGALPCFRLLIAGDGDESDLRAEAVRMGVQDRVRFLGQLNRDRMVELLRAADIFALPSLYEGQSNVLLEAMAAGLPIVASDIPCHRETLNEDHEKNDFVIPITEPDRWIEKLQQLAQDRVLRKELGRRALRRVEFFSLTRMRSEFEKTFA